MYVHDCDMRLRSVQRLRDMIIVNEKRSDNIVIVCVLSNRGAAQHAAAIRDPRLIAAHSRGR